ncbi:MAG: penicillin-binding protein activator [Gammaproteobacteria bacterium]|nr:penicillin-binding protein activator [Gammaproteobacteria bacterium]
MALTLVSCATDPPREDVRPVQVQISRLIKQGNLAGAAAAYWEQAKGVDSPRREDLQLRAVETVLTPKTTALAKRYLSMIPADRLAGTALVRARIAQARLGLMDGQHNVALAALPPGLSLTTPDFYTQVEELRAQALLAAGRVLDSVRVRSALTTEIIDQKAIAANHQKIWEALARASDQELARWLRVERDPRLRGWLELGYIAKTSPADFDSFDRQLDDWQRRYAGHPAGDTLLAQLRRDWRSLQVRPRQIAVMLPLSGAYASVSSAVLAGFMTAHYTDEIAPDKPSIRIYDVGSGDDARQVYQQAVREGADFVVGPLDKEGVAALAQNRRLPVPVLSLNYSDEKVGPPNNLYEFGLLPEDEARQAAERASLAGHRTALVLAPVGEWGERLLNTFRARFEDLGGTVLAVNRYDESAADFAAPIKDVLGIDMSEQRNSELRSLLNLDLQFEPRRRPDADMMFMVALPRQARLLRPQLRFHFASDLPVYSTSHIYTGIADPGTDRDIDGVMYCDMPWTVPGANPLPALRARMDRLFPQESQQLPRLAALGFDAYRVIYYLKRLAARPYERYAGLTGTLHMDARGRLHRALQWAQFVDGSATVMDSLRAPPGSLAAQTAP